MPAEAVDPMQTVIEIVKAHPGSNQSQIVELAQNAGVSKHKVEECLRNGPFSRERGHRNEWLYSLADDPASQIPAPIEQGNREIEPSPAEVVA